MKIEIGKTYRVRGQIYRVESISGGKVHAYIGGFVLPYEYDQFCRMVRTK